ncbi:MAG: Ku protein [Chloroflexota bacterium]
MARSMWRGAIQFGLVTIPVKLYLATESRGGLSFNLLHKPDLQRIQMKTYCPEHGEIPRSDTVRGYEWSKGQYVVIEEEDFEKVPLKTVRAIEIDRFVPASRDSYAATFVKQAYYLEPEAVGRKAFLLLREVLADAGLQAICKIVLKDREQLCALDPFADTMLLSTLYWPDEVRDVGELDLPTVETDFKPAEVAMARQLVDAMTGEFDPAQYRDEYREALLRVIEAKVEGEEVEAPAPVVETRGLTDLMAVLEASVAAARQKGAGAAEETPATAAKGGKGRAKDAEPVSVDEARKARAARPAAEKPAPAKGGAAGATKAAAKAPAARKATASAAAAAAEDEAPAKAAPARRRKSA